jgi:hypothetical protein
MPLVQILLILNNKKIQQQQNTPIEKEFNSLVFHVIDRKSKQETNFLTDTTIPIHLAKIWPRSS